MVPCEPVSIPSSSPAPGPSHPLNHPALSPSHFEETPRCAVVLSNMFQCIALKNKSSLKDTVMICVPLSIFWGCEEAEVEWFYEDLQDSRTNTQKRCPFHYRGLKCKSRKSRNTWNNRQIWPWSTTRVQPLLDPGIPSGGQRW